MSVSRIRQFLGADFHVLQTLLQRSWSLVAGILTVALIPLFLTPVEQGFYYAFGSLVSLQIFFELGLNYVVVQIVAHEASHLSRGADGAYEGSPNHLNRLASIVQLLRRWYQVASVCFLIGVAVAGALFFGRDAGMTLQQWLPVWLVLVTATSVNLFYSPFLAVLEGSGDVGQVARLRLRQAIVGAVLMWGALAIGAGLWAVVLAPLTLAVSTPFWLAGPGRGVGRLRGHVVDPANAVVWKREIFPFQWRIALSWISGYFIMQFFTPMIFAHQGAAEAGRVGLSMTMFTAVQSLGVSWVAAKAPVLAAAVAQGSRETLNTVFKAVALRSLAFVAAGCLGITGLVWLANGLELGIAARVVGPASIVCIAAATFANTAVFAAAAYIRAHKEEPMLGNSLVSGLLSLGGVYIASYEGVLPTMMVYLGVVTLVSLPWAMILFGRYYRRAAS